MHNTLVFIVTVGMTADILLRGQLMALQKAGFEVTVVSSPDDDFFHVGPREGVQTVGIPIARDISPLRDIVTLWRLVLYLHRVRPTIVNASTPKAGMLGMLAAWIARVPVRVYQQRGLRLETTSGFQHTLLLWSARVTAACAHYVVCNSRSLMQALQDRAIGRGKLLVLGSGSSNGVDTSRFHPLPADSPQRMALRQDLGIAATAPVIGFVGRLTRDKGIVELLDAFDRVRVELPESRLLLVGPFEAGDPLPEQSVRQIKQDSAIVWVDYVTDTARYYQAMGVLAFPSHREGLPNVPLEAAASGVPTVGFAATGTVDAVKDGCTGFLVPVGDTAALAAGLLRLLREHELRQQIALQARQYVEGNYSQAVVWQNWEAFYHDILEQRIPPLGQARR